MTLAYFDTSALLKLFIDEDGSGQAGAMWDAADSVLTGRVAQPEARAALAAAARALRLTRSQHRAAKGELARLWSDLHVIELAPRIAELAGDLAERHALRGYDAVHLASAREATGGDAVFVTWDRPLAAAALSEGMAIAPPLG